MADFISSWGKSAAEIRHIAATRSAPSSVVARVRVRGFQRLCDAYGHAVKLELPGAICGFLRSRPGCACAEVLHTPNLADAVVIGVFESADAADAALEALSGASFQLAHRTLPCPPLAVTRGSLDDALPDEPDARRG